MSVPSTSTTAPSKQEASPASACSPPVAATQPSSASAAAPSVSAATACPAPAPAATTPAPHVAAVTSALAATGTAGGSALHVSATAAPVASASVPAASGTSKPAEGLSPSPASAAANAAGPAASGTSKPAAAPSTPEPEAPALKPASKPSAPSTMDAVESKLSTLSLSSADLTLEGIAARIKNGTAKRVLFMVGAGISVAAGIPDFRTPGTGLYDNLKKYNLPAPEAVFNREYYLENPDPFCQLSEEMWPGKWKPTTAHFFIRLMHQKGHLLRCYSQNIDTLEREAGLPADMLVEAHGSFLAGEHCAACGKDYDPGFFRQKLTEKKRPVCDTCKVGFVKPRITFFGEQLPTRFFSLVTKDFQEGDLLIVMGTSLKVNPFARLISAVRDDVPRILFNNMPAGVGPAGFQFGMPDNKRDVLWLGDVQDGVRKFAEAVGWAADLKALENAYKPSTSASVTPTPSL